MMARLRPLAEDLPVHETCQRYSILLEWVSTSIQLSHEFLCRFHSSSRHIPQLRNGSKALDGASFRPASLLGEPLLRPRPLDPEAEWKQTGTQKQCSSVPCYSTPGFDNSQHGEATETTTHLFITGTDLTACSAHNYNMCLSWTGLYDYFQQHPPAIQGNSFTVVQRRNRFFLLLRRVLGFEEESERILLNRESDVLFDELLSAQRIFLAHAVTQQVFDSVASFNWNEVEKMEAGQRQMAIIEEEEAYRSICRRDREQQHRIHGTMWRKQQDAKLFELHMDQLEQSLLTNHLLNWKFEYRRFLLARRDEKRARITAEMVRREQFEMLREDRLGAQQAFIRASAKQFFTQHEKVQDELLGFRSKDFLGMHADLSAEVFQTKKSEAFLYSCLLKDLHRICDDEATYRNSDIQRESVDRNELYRQEAIFRKMIDRRHQKILMQIQRVAAQEEVYRHTHIEDYFLFCVKCYADFEMGVREIVDRHESLRRQLISTGASEAKERISVTIQHRHQLLHLNSVQAQHRAAYLWEEHNERLELSKKRPFLN